MGTTYPATKWFPHGLVSRRTRWSWERWVGCWADGLVGAFLGVSSSVRRPAIAIGVFSSPTRRPEIARSIHQTRSQSTTDRHLDSVALDLFWEGWFGGVFKGLIRRTAILDPRLAIRRTRGCIFPERAWFLAAALQGPLRFVPEATHIKSFYADSTHAIWRVRWGHFLSTTRAMLGYFDASILDPPTRRLAREYLR